MTKPSGIQHFTDPKTNSKIPVACDDILTVRAYDQTFIGGLPNPGYYAGAKALLVTTSAYLPFVPVNENFDQAVSLWMAGRSEVAGEA